MGRVLESISAVNLRVPDPGYYDSPIYVDDELDNMYPEVTGDSPEWPSEGSKSDRKYTPI